MLQPLTQPDQHCKINAAGTMMKYMLKSIIKNIMSYILQWGGCPCRDFVRFTSNDEIIPEKPHLNFNSVMDNLAIMPSL